MTTRHEENSRDGQHLDKDGVSQHEVLGVKPFEFLLKVGVLLEVLGVKPRGFEVDDLIAQDEVIGVIPRAFEVHPLELLLKVGKPLAQDEVISVKPRPFEDLELSAIGLEDILKHSLNDHIARHIYTGTDPPSMLCARNCRPFAT